MTMTHLGVASCNCVSDKIVKLNKIVAGIINTRGPYLSNSLPVTGDNKPLIKLPGNSRIPAVAAASPSGPCIYTGKIISEANIIIMIMTNNNTPKEYIGYLNTRKSNTGASNFNCLKEKINKAIPPTTIGTYEIGDKNPAGLLPAELKPNTTPPNPIVEQTIERTSIFGFVTSDILIKYLYANTIENSANAKIERAHV